MKRVVFLLVLGLFILQSAISYAVSAYPGLIEFVQPDGSIVNIYLKGDEQLKWAQTEDGYTLLYNRAGYLEYAVLDSKSDLVPSGVIAKNISQRDNLSASLLSNTSKELFFSNSQISIIKQIKNIQKQESNNSKSFPTTGSRKLICLLIGFSDLSFTKTQTEFYNLFNQVSYTTGGATGSVKDFYLENSYNLFNLSVDVAGPYTASQSQAYYGANDINGNDTLPRTLVMEAINLADPDVDYSDFDNDADGYVDGIYIIYAGYGEEAGGGANCIWAHAWSTTSPITVDGVYLNRYSCSPELRGNSGTNLTRIGVICHEFGHVLGAPDYYDTDYGTGGEFSGTGNWDVMASGTWNNSGATPAHHNGFTKVVCYNWASTTVLSTPSIITLNNAEENSNSFYRVNTSTTNEYFFLENREQHKFDGYIPGSGMIIYHVHSAVFSDTYKINATYPQKMYPVAQNATTNPGSTPASYGTINASTCVWTGEGSTKNKFMDGTTPTSKSWAGANTGKPITAISRNASAKTVTFDILGNPRNITAVTISTSQINLSWALNTLGNQVIVAWSADGNFGTPVNGTTYTAGNTISGGGTIIYAGSATSFNHTGLNIGTTYYYKAWSVLTGTNYSLGMTTNATTQTGNPTTFTAIAANSTQINLNWGLNSSNNNVIVAWTADDNFGTPVNGTSYTAGSTIPGGGAVIYAGNATSFYHSGLNLNTTYYYKAWSVLTGTNYSTGTTASATTECLPVRTSFPFVESFDTPNASNCWEVIDNYSFAHLGNEQKWEFGTMDYGLTGSTGIYAYINSDAWGSGNSQNTDLISPSFDFSGYTGVNVSFKHFYAWYQDGDKATFSYSTDDGLSWTSAKIWYETTATNATFDTTIVALAGQSQVKFKWNFVGEWSYFWSVDDISVTATASSSLTVSNTTVSLSSNMAYQNVTIKNDGELTIEDDKILTVTGNFIIESDVNGTGSFVDNGSVIIQGNTEVYRFLPYDANDLGWYISAPIKNASDAVLRTDADGIYYYNAPTAHWALVPASSTLTPMLGYVTLYNNYGSISGNKTVNFTGSELNTGSVSNNNLVRTTSPVNYGWNLVGNPYPSSIDWDLVVGSDNMAFINSTHLNPTVYIRNHDGSVRTYTPNITTEDPGRIISSTQAFWVQVNSSYASASLSLNNTHRVHGTNIMEKSTSSDLLNLKIERDGLINFSDVTKIYFKNGATEDNDEAYDAVKMFSQNAIHPQIYSILANNEELAVNSYPELTSGRSVALGFNTETEGLFTISSEGVSTFNNNVNIILEDTYENVLIDLNQNDSYTFSSPVNNSKNRFIVHFYFTPSLIENGSVSDIDIYTHENAVYISNVSEDNTFVNIYNILGEIVVSKGLTANTLNKVNTSLAGGQYIVKVMGNKTNKTQKVFLK